MPQALIIVLGAIGAVIAAKLIAKEWRRVTMSSIARVDSPPAQCTRGVAKSQRDPVTGEYRPVR